MVDLTPYLVPEPNNPGKRVSAGFWNNHLNAVQEGINTAQAATGKVDAATNRTALKAQNSTTKPSALLQESARWGVFGWDGTVPIATHQADTREGLYVPPSASANGAWVRRFSGRVDVTWFGAVADCTAVGVGTDNAAAFNAAIAMCNRLGKASLFVPRGRYRIASRLQFTQSIDIEGEGWTENPGIAGGVSYSGINAFEGSLLVFDADTAGLIFYAQTDNASAAAVAASYASLGLSSPEWMYKSARASRLANLMLYGGGGTNVAAHGVEIRTAVLLSNVRADYFAGSGFVVEASTHTNTTPYGNAFGASFSNIVSRANKLHGFRIRGNDANVIPFHTCDAALNGGVGFLDDGQLGNSYTNCHSATNNQSFGTSTTQRTQALADWAGLSDQYAGSFVCTSTVGAHTYSGCYIEGGVGYKASLITPAIIKGGNLAATANLVTGSTAIIYGYTAIENLLTLRPLTGNPLTADTDTFRVEKATGNVTIDIKPVAGTFSNLKMWSANTMSSGLDVLVGGTVSYWSCNEFYYRNAAQSQTFASITNSGIDIVAATPQLKISGTKVVGTRQTGTAANATDLATAITLVNDLKAKLIAHGLIS